MKKIKSANFILVLVVLASQLVGCKKDDGDEQGTKKMYLAKIFIDGKLSTEYIYGAGENLPSRLNTYDTSGNIQSYRTMKYSNGILSELHYYKNSGESSFFYKYKYNSNHLLSTSYYYRNDTSTSAYTIGQYFYNLENVCTMYKDIDADSVLRWQEKYEFSGKNIAKTEYYNSNGELKSTVFSTYDNMNYAFEGLSAIGTVKQVNNLVERTSPDADANGELLIHLEKVAIRVSLYRSEFEYNNLNYPVKEIRTLTAKPNLKQVYTYEYKE